MLNQFLFITEKSSSELTTITLLPQKQHW